jgi:oligopeptidase B
MHPPIASKKPTTLTKHGDERVDNYFWMNNREDSEVIDYLNAENDYTNEVMADTKDFREKLYNEIIGRIKQTDESVPYKKNGYWYYNRFEEGQEYPISCRKKDSMENEEEILLNVNELAKGRSYCHISGISISNNNTLMIYGVDFVGRRDYTLYLKNLTTGEIKDIGIGNTTGNAVWATDNLHFFYTAKDPKTLRCDRIFRSDLESLKSVEVYHERDETFNCFVGKSKSEAYLVIGCSSTLTSEMRFMSSDDPLGKFVIFHPREKGLEYSAGHFEDKWYVVTNLNAKNFRLMECGLSNTTKENWKEKIAHRENTLLEGLEVFQHFLVLEERRDGLSHLRVMNQQNGQEHYLNFGEETYTAWTGTNPEYETEILRYGYTSMTTPSSVFDYDMNTRDKKLLKQQEVVGGYNPEEYLGERRFAVAADGVKIPISLVYKKSLKRENGNPLLLYGYGSYGNSLDPYFSSTRLSLLDRGFVFAIAHIRGGEEMGRHWYESGRQMLKKNTFTDFISSAEYLIENKYTDANNLFGMGGSAGGLLMGAVVNMRPDLWKGIVAQVAFVDVLTTMLDDSIPLTTGEYDEWGNPNEEDYYHYIKSYSPYDNVATKDYPNMLVTTGLHDSQVQYWEPAKWVAKLRDVKTDNNLLLLHTNMEAGHGGASGRFEQYREVALEYAFLLKLCGINK